jgi:hypothetical protein
MPKTIIRVGHPAYSGPNRAKWCKGKAAAVRELRLRGFKRDDARDLVDRVAAKDAGWVVGTATRYSCPVEISNYTNDPLVQIMGVS